MIKLLDEQTIQKISAGEVIERPASIVKELFENAVDAGGNVIQVEIVNGGKDLISVIDNGRGISHDQVELAFQRHATSKIDNFDDLYSIYTMGFRGEALASIVAAADVELKSKTSEEDLGTRIKYENGEIVDKSRIAMNTGTIIRVYDIFKNMPVRKNFLKSSIAEGNQITDILTKLSLANPDLSVKFTRDNRLVFNINDVDNHIEKNRKIFGNDLANSLVEIEGRSDNFSLQGYISDNSYFRGNRAMQYVYINNRFVESPSISTGVESRYKHIIPNGKFPAFQVYISTDAKNLDVNIHPNKTKVDIIHSEELLDLIKTSVSKALSPDKLTKIHLSNEGEEEVKLFTDPDSKYTDLLNKYSDRNGREKGEEESKRYKYKDLDQEEDQGILHDLTPRKDKGIAFGQEEDTSQDIQLEEVSLDNFVREEEEHEVSRTDPASYSFLDLVGNDKLARGSHIEDVENYTFLAAIFNTYLIYENNKGENILILDQHAGHERINFERIKNYYYSAENSKQSLLVDLQIDLLASEINLVKDNIDLFNDFGFTIPAFGSNYVLISEVPALADIDPKMLFEDLLNGLNEYGEFKSEYMLDEIAEKACKSSIKAHDPLSSIEALDLLRELNETEYPLTCPHGRPTFIIIEKSSIEKEFKRIK